MKQRDTGLQKVSMLHVKIRWTMGVLTCLTQPKSQPVSAVKTHQPETGLSTLALNTCPGSCSSGGCEPTHVHSQARYLLLPFSAPRSCPANGFRQTHRETPLQRLNPRVLSRPSRGLRLPSAASTSFVFRDCVYVLFFGGLLTVVFVGLSAIETSLAISSSLCVGTLRRASCQIPWKSIIYLMV